MRFNEPFFKRGDFPATTLNGSTPVAVQDPWINGTNATPFDQGAPLPLLPPYLPLIVFTLPSYPHAEFYLILDVGVGSTNGWFPEDQGGKPWLDQAASMSLLLPTEIYALTHPRQTRRTTSQLRSSNGTRHGHQT